MVAWMWSDCLISQYPLTLYLIKKVLYKNCFAQEVIILESEDLKELLEGGIKYDFHFIQYRFLY